VPHKYERAAAESWMHRHLPGHAGHVLRHALGRRGCGWPEGEWLVRAVETSLAPQTRTSFRLHRRDFALRLWRSSPLPPLRGGDINPISQLSVRESRYAALPTGPTEKKKTKTGDRHPPPPAPALLLPPPFPLPPLEIHRFLSPRPLPYSSSPPPWYPGIQVMVHCSAHPQRELQYGTDRVTRLVFDRTSFHSSFSCSRHAVHTLNRCSRVWATPGL
jgi:hypothetical protein